MSTVDGRSDETGGTPNSAAVDLKLEVAVLPVADGSTAFYAGLGWRRDADFSFDNGFRLVQFTPTGSSRSVQFGTKITGAPPGIRPWSLPHRVQAVVGREELMSRGAEVSEVFHSGGPGAQLDPEGTSGRVSGSDPDHKSYSLFATFEDADGNSWLLEEAAEHLPGRLDPTITSFNSAGDLVGVSRRALTAHGEHEKRIGKSDPEWPNWYADYVVDEQTDQRLPA
jgi:catechol 2,3-dioxygenase-like lactoylglutathione lyase family enzyme